VSTVTAVTLTRRRHPFEGRSPGLGDLLDLPPLGQRELQWAATLVLGVQRAEPVSVEVVDYITDPVLAGERHLGDRGHIHALS
jgi:hypothetical protein